MNKHIVNSFLVWAVAGLICILISALLSSGRKADFLFVLPFVLAIGIILSAIISGILSYLSVTSTVVSLIIAMGLSIYIGIEFRHDIGFWNYDGTLHHLLKIIKNCIIYFPLTYFGISYFFTLIFKKILALFAK